MLSRLWKSPLLGLPFAFVLLDNDDDALAK